MDFFFCTIYFYNELFFQHGGPARLPFPSPSFKILSHLLSQSSGLFLQMRYQGHGLLSTFWALLLCPSLNLLRENGKKLFNYQLLEDLLLGPHFWLQPPAAEFPEFTESFVGSRHVLVGELPEAFTKGLTFGAARSRQNGL